MRIQRKANNYQQQNQTFEARKFKLPIKEIELTNPYTMACGKGSIKTNLYRVYENPNAKILYKQAQNAENWEEKARLYAEMGHYELADYGSGIKGFFRKLFNFKKPLLALDLTDSITFSTYKSSNV